MNKRVLDERLPGGIPRPLFNIDGRVAVTALGMSGVLSLMIVLSYVCVWTAVEAPTQSSSAPRHVVAVFFDLPVALNKLFELVLSPVLLERVRPVSIGTGCSRLKT